MKAEKTVRGEQILVGGIYIYEDGEWTCFGLSPEISTLHMYPVADHRKRLESLGYTVGFIDLPKGEYKPTPKEERLAQGDAWVICQQCDNKIYGFNGNQDKRVPCPYQDTKGNCKPKRI